jgi:fatty-acyl-CoA synthase
VADLFPGPVLAALSRPAAGPFEVGPAFEVGSRTVTRADLLTMVRRLAAALRAAGLGPGSGVGMVLALTPEAYALHLAAHTLGCRVAPARPTWSPPQLAHAVRGHDALVVDSTVHPGTAVNAGRTGRPDTVPVLRLAELLATDDPGGELPALARADDVARLTYTSGSTGQPKACAHTYRAITLAYQADRWAPVLARLMGHFGRCLVHQNLASPVMFTYLGRCLVAGGTVVLPDGRPLPSVIQEGRVTATMIPPARVNELLASGADLRGLRALLLGGSPAGPQLLRTATERLGPIVWMGYGQGEAGVVAMLTPEDIAAGHLTSVGRPMPGVDVDIRDGEIWVRSPHMMTGYWGEPDETREVLRHGWLRTRDLGFLDADGRLHLTGRSREVIMVNAEVCYAGAIERVLAGHPLVAEAYVVGRPDPRTGEAVHAYVVPVGDQAPDPTALTELVRATLSANSVPNSITLIREVPVGASGKPDKRALENHHAP